MNDRIHRHLDGDRAVELDAAERSEASAWDRMLDAFRSSAPGGGNAPPWLEQRVMAEIEALPADGPLRRALAWLVRPAPIRVSPLAAGLVAASIALLVALPYRGEAPDPGGSAGPSASSGTPSEETVVYVQFVLEAPEAVSVSVAGDFSDWEPSFALVDPDGDGVWTGRVPVRPGVHAYMFLVDEAQWRTDPNAERYRDDGFGNRNALLAVASGV